MKREIDINATFATLRKLPVEIRFEQVEQWVEQLPPQQYPPVASTWLPYWLAKLATWRPFN